MDLITSSSHKATNARVFEIVTAENLASKRVLDVGAGRGYLAALLSDHVRSLGGDPAEVLRACDMYPEYFMCEGVSCARLAFVNELPYDEGTFDVVYSVEVIEHLSNPHGLIREMYRVVRPGGMIVVTTPNILNLSSRLRYLLTGFFEMFPPPSLSPQDARRQWGHIMPMTAYHLAHAMRMAGFEDVTFHADRLKKSAVFLWVVLLPLTAPALLASAARLRARKPSVYRENARLVWRMMLPGLCSSRSAILVGRKRIREGVDHVEGEVRQGGRRS